MTQQCRMAEGVNQLTANMDEEKSKVKMMSTGTPATPPPTPTYPAMLADRRSANRNSTGNIVPLRTPAKGRVADVIDSFGRRRSSSCSESLPESPKYIGFPLAENGDGIKKSQSFFQYEGVLPSQVDSKPKVNTVPDARPTQPQEPQEKMDLSNEKEETPAKAKYAVMVAELDAENYNMSHERRGYFLILNHDKFDCPNMDRPGSEVDVNELKTTAAALGFEPIICNNLTYQEISETINKVATMDHSNADCLGIAVLTHGEHHGYLHAKDCLYSVEKLWTPFTADACPTLAGKPKLFFIQACRGQRLDEGIAVRRTETDSGVNSYKIPSIADFLISYSTVDGYYSWRNPENGTWFIRSLCEELRDWAPRGKEFLQILVKVHARVAFQYQSFNEKDPSFDAKKQIPSFVCMLTRCLYLMPKETQTSAVGSDGKC
ncbi:caspase-1-like isoform X2 [Ischnura elegans]|uniref:caspase-1-like isoform X2 n=1 Tax=Ischnura elegans TaxID=197161 RepID=UPI001ED877B0|nr:caspase-1-like isoform X2 [Ischnura elegans]